MTGLELLARARSLTAELGAAEPAAAELSALATAIATEPLRASACMASGTQRHFLAALMIVTGQGVTVEVVRRLQDAYAPVRNSRGEPITAATWDPVIGVLAGVLGELGTPPATLVALASQPLWLPGQPEPCRHRFLRRADGGKARRTGCPARCRRAGGPSRRAIGRCRPLGQESPEPSRPFQKEV